MALSCELSPLAYAKLYVCLRADSYARDALAERVARVGFDEDVLAELESGYRALWQFHVEQAGGNQATLWGLDDRHARLATWLLAGLRRPGEPSQELSAIIRRAVGEQFQASFGNVPLPDVVQPIVIAWTLGQVYGGLDVALPAVPAIEPPDPDVAMAYAGLVSHLCGLGRVAQPWPEVTSSATIWRAAGIIDGLKPQPIPNLRQAISEAMTQAKDVIPAHVVRDLTLHWDEFRRVRNGLTHVVPSEEGYAFSDVADRASTWEGIRLCVNGITHMVFSEVSLSVLEAGAGFPAAQLVGEITDELDGWVSGLADN